MRIPGAALLGLEVLPDELDDERRSGTVAGTDGAGPRSPALRRLAWTVLACAVIAVVGWAVAFSSILGVRQVTVRGESLLSEGTVREAADIVQGAPLARLDTGAIRDRIEALPEVASAEVTVSYPSSVIIKVIERVPVGYRTTADAVWLVDSGDLAFRRVDAAPAGLPELPAGGDDGARASALVAAALPQPLRVQVASIEAKSSNSVEMTLGDGRTVIWGGSVRNEQKAALLGSLLGQPGDTFDISAEGVVVVR